MFSKRMETNGTFVKLGETHCYLLQNALVLVQADQGVLNQDSAIYLLNDYRANL